MELSSVQAAIAPLTADERELSRAIALLTQHTFLEPLLSAALADGYQFLIDPALWVTAAHDAPSGLYPKPGIRFCSGRTCAQYAESLCHELIHYAITGAGRVFGVELNPIADIAMRYCEEAVVLAITSDLMYQAARGINMKDGNAYPELWAANVGSSKYTSKAYENHAGNRYQALQKSFECFYTLPRPDYRKTYQEASLKGISSVNTITQLNPENFTEKFDPASFVHFIPAPYDEILAPCLVRMNPLDREHLVLNFSVAQKIEVDFFVPRATTSGTRPPNWKIFVEDTNGDVFPWRLAGEGLASQRPMPRRPDCALSHPALVHAF